MIRATLVSLVYKSIRFKNYSKLVIINFSKFCCLFLILRFIIYLIYLILLRVFILEKLRRENNKTYYIEHHFYIVFTSSLQCLIMSNDLRAENRRHRHNERNQAKREEINRRQNERNQSRTEHIKHKMHRIARNNVVIENNYLGEMNHICTL